MSTLEIPLFPLKTVLFPGGVLPLRIFEPRYLDMVSQCLKSDSRFGVVAIVEGNEAGTGATFTEMGTLAQIVDFDQLEDGLLGLTCRGDLLAFCDDLRRRGVRMAVEPWEFKPGLVICYVEAPDGVSIEIIQAAA